MAGVRQHERPVQAGAMVAHSRDHNVKLTEVASSLLSKHVLPFPLRDAGDESIGDGFTVWGRWERRRGRVRHPPTVSGEATRG
ncbi:hypothetical protein [Kribbella sp. C-35]|uniref:hypothetical protein n=1 Tax=Kribbella sp. C-35 TaxID=2789276 RepID=UPI00397B1B69